MSAEVTTTKWGVEDLDISAAGGTFSRTRLVAGVSTTVTPARINATTFPLSTTDAAEVVKAGGVATQPSAAVVELAKRVRATVADLAALKAIPTASITNGQLCWVESLQVAYAFDTDATGANDDDLVIRPTDYATAGNWIKPKAAHANTAGSATTATSATEASQLKTTGANVVVNTAAPPLAGQVLKATSATAAEWQTLTSMANPMNALGDVIYGGASPAGDPTRLAPNTSTTPKVLTMTGSGSAGAAPSWSNVSTAMLAANAVTKVGYDDDTSEFSTTSTTFVDITGVSFSLTTDGGDILLFLALPAITSTGPYAIFGVSFNGTDYTLTHTFNSQKTGACGIYLLTGIAAGTYTVKARMKAATAGTVYVNCDSHSRTSLLAVELKR